MMHIDELESYDDLDNSEITKQDLVRMLRETKQGIIELEKENSSDSFHVEFLARCKRDVPRLKIMIKECID